VNDGLKQFNYNKRLKYYGYKGVEILNLIGLMVGLYMIQEKVDMKLIVLR
jgi:hypothetical protein